MNHSQACQIPGNVFKFGSADEVLCITVGPEQFNLPVIGGIPHISQHAQHGGNADAAGYQDQRLLRRADKVAEKPERPVQGQGIAFADVFDARGPVTAVLDGESQPVRLRGRRADRKRVSLSGNGVCGNGDESELAG